MRGSSARVVSRRRPRAGRAALVIGGCLLVTLVSAGWVGSTSGVRQGGIFRITLNPTSGIDYIDPALASSPPGWALLDTTCARLMAYPDKPPPQGFRLQPEVAAAFPKVSRDRKTYTFRLRSGFRFSNGAPVRASAFARAINRTLAPGLNSPAVYYTRDILGADDVLAGKSPAARGVVARGNTLVIRLTRPAPDFPHRTASTFFCAVPPTLPVDPEGVGAFPAAGPYYVVEYRRGERVVLRRNRFYGGRRPHHVNGFDVDFRAASPQEVLQRVERGDADWGHTLSGIYFDPALRLVEKYGLKGPRLFLRRGLTLRMLAFNSARPLFRNNPSLRRAVNFALDRQALVSVGGPRVSRATDQYLPSILPAFKDSRIYPLARPDLNRAKALARGNLRGGSAVLYVANAPIPLAIGQLVKRQLAEIGLEVTVRGIPIHSATAAYFNKLGTPGEPWDVAFGLWSPSYIDPYAYINLLLDARYIGGSNFLRFASPRYDRRMREAAGIPQAQRRNSAYAALDAQLARDPAPFAPVDFLNEPTLVSKRVGCIILRPVLDLTAVCLK
jgi:ABC-type oligopeptide transport system substrate-binding subunit